MLSSTRGRALPALPPAERSPMGGLLLPAGGAAGTRPSSEAATAVLPSMLKAWGRFQQCLARFLRKQGKGALP